MNQEKETNPSPLTALGSPAHASKKQLQFQHLHKITGKKSYVLTI